MIRDLCVVADLSAQVVADLSAQVVADLSAQVVADLSAQVVADLSAIKEIILKNVHQIENITSGIKVDFCEVERKNRPK
ncbi:MAG: hypothetical protein V1833_03740 [Elusimicrobiota bacterium]